MGVNSCKKRCTIPVLCRNDATGCGKMHKHYDAWKAEVVYEEDVCSVFLARTDLATYKGVDSLWC